MKLSTKILIPVLVGILLGVGLWWGLREGRGAERPLEASGTVEATESDLGFQASGRILGIGPEEGDDVVEGEEVARLDHRELEAARDAADARLETARAQLRELRRGSRPGEVARARAALAAARQRADETRRSLERARRLFEGGAISEEALDRAETAAAVAGADAERASEALQLLEEGPRAEKVEAQEARVRAAEAALDGAEALLANATIVAPFSGIVTVRHREPGEVVGPGAPVLTLRDPDDRWVRIYVPGDAIGRVSVGQGATVTSDTYPDRRYEGRVTFIGSEAEFTPRNVQTPEERTRLVYPVKIRITGDPSYDLKPGIPADVSLEVPEVPPDPEEGETG